MNEIGADFEILPGMAGNVKYYKKPCPFGERSMFGNISLVGSTACRMCQHYQDTVETRTEQGEIFAECVLCKHDKEV